MNTISENDYFIILPSNVSGDLHRENTTSSYTTHFSNPLLFDGNYEVALSEIHYPHSFLNIFPDNRRPIFLKKRVGRKYKTYSIRLKGYFSPESLVKTINDKWQNSNLEIGSTIAYSENTHRFTIQCARTEEIKLSGNICNQLGFAFNSVSINRGAELTSSAPADLDFMGHIFYVYISCIKEYLIGNQYAKLLRLISVQGKHGDNIYESYPLPYYHELNSKNVNSIDLSIRDMVGNPIRFEYGTVIMKLHFRKIHK